MDLKNYKFSKDHEWVKLEDDMAVIGVSDYAQKEMGDVVYIELPETGSSFSEGDTCSNIESVKAVNDIFTPLSGEVVEVNTSLEDTPENINTDPYGSGWIFKIKISDSAELTDLLDADQYEEYLKGI
ncbi:MAG: glycine cleavage system protein GcvH [Candidatus Aminicenantes bacterium]|nr:glycine cleavage system protein GcvH [Candidatus Aminicenantes bacterium]